jgi:hypothetical protein
MTEPTVRQEAEKSAPDFAATNPKMFQCVSRQDWWLAPWFQTWLQLAGHVV